MRDRFPWPSHDQHGAGEKPPSLQLSPTGSSPAHLPSHCGYYSKEKDSSLAFDFRSLAPAWPQPLFQEMSNQRLCALCYQPLAGVPGPYLAGCKGPQVRRKARAPNPVCLPDSLHALTHDSQPSFPQDDVDDDGTHFGVAEN